MSSFGATAQLNAEEHFLETSGGTGVLGHAREAAVEDAHQFKSSQPGRRERGKPWKMAYVLVPLMLALLAGFGISRHVSRKAAKARLVDALLKNEDLLKDPHANAKKAVKEYIDAKERASKDVDSKSRKALTDARKAALKAINEEKEALKWWTTAAEMASADPKAFKAEGLKKEQVELYEKLVKKLPKVVELAVEVLESEKLYVSSTQEPTPKSAVDKVKTSRDALNREVTSMAADVELLRLEKYFQCLINLAREERLLR